MAAAKPDGSMFYATTPTYILTSLLSKPSKTYRDLEPLVNFFTDSEMHLHARRTARTNR